MGKLICLMLVTLSLAACQTGDGVTSTGDHVSGDVPELSESSAAALAGDIAKGFVERSDLNRDAAVTVHGDHPVFEEALKAALGGEGFKIASDDGPDATQRITFAIGHIDGDVLVRLSAASLVVTRVYSVAVAGATPAGPYSVLTR